MAIYRCWQPNENPRFPHELTHLVAHTWREPYLWQMELGTVEMVSTSFMQEGLAMAIDEIVFGRNLFFDCEYKFIDDWCRKGEKYPDIVDVINFNGFCAFENKIVLPYTASFSKFLLKTFGVRKYKEFYVGIREIFTPGENLKIMERIYSFKEEDLLLKWRENLSYLM